MLGTGAQKAGTTWLYRYLEESPEFVAGYRKEYHVFDVLDLPSESWTRDRNIRLAEEALASIRDGRPADAAVLHRMSMIADPTHYFDYFTALVRSDERHVTADVTPAYALLPVERLASIRREFDRRGVRAVAIFLMRDPVDRLWSQIRMQRRRSTRRTDGTDEAHLLQRHTESQYVARSAYHRTIDALDAAFGDSVHYAFYEQLFAEESIAAVCSSIGIAIHPPDLRVRRNQAPVEATLSESAARQVAENLIEVYRRVAHRFPEVDLPAIWPSARYVL